MTTTRTLTDRELLIQTVAAMRKTVDDSYAYALHRIINGTDTHLCNCAECGDGPGHEYDTPYDPATHLKTVAEFVNMGIPNRQESVHRFFGEDHLPDPATVRDPFGPHA